MVLWMNTVGPYHNRQETYNYYSLPFCRGQKTEIGHYHETLAENIQGTELEFSGIDISFKGKDLKKMHRLGGVAHKLKNIFGQAKSHNKFITGKSCQLFLNLVYGRTVPNEFPTNLLMDGFC